LVVAIALFVPVLEICSNALYWGKTNTNDHSKTHVVSSYIASFGILCTHGFIFFAINLPMLQLAMCSAGLAILPSTVWKNFPNTQEAKKNVKGTQTNISFFVRNTVAVLMCIYMLLANLGSTTKKDTDALIPRFLHATVGFVFPSLRQYWGMYVRPPKPLEMCGIEWHVIGRLNGEASTGSIDLLQWLQLGTLSRPSNVTAGSSCSSMYSAKMWRMFFHKAVTRRLLRAVENYAIHSDKYNVSEENHCNTTNAGEECVLLTAFLEYICKYWKTMHAHTSLEAIDIYGNVIMARMNKTQLTEAILLPVIQDSKCKTID
jgi:hypothetical protein